MTWPMVCTLGLLLFMALPMESCWFSCSLTLQGHTDAAENFFHQLKHLIFSTFLLSCGITYFPGFQHCKFSQSMWIWSSYESYTAKCWIVPWHLPGAPMHTTVLCSICSLQETSWGMPVTVWLSQPCKLAHLIVVCGFSWVTGFQPIFYELHVSIWVFSLLTERAFWSVLPLCKIVLHGT